MLAQRRWDKGRIFELVIPGLTLDENTCSSKFCTYWFQDDTKGTVENSPSVRSFLMTSSLMIAHCLQNAISNAL
jgi:hypothetical protein